MTVIPYFNNNDKINSYAYMLESFNIWHGRLRYVNFNFFCVN